MSRLTNLAIATFILVYSTIAQAGIITFDNRSAFEAYISNSVTDDLSDISNGGGSTFNRRDFTYNGSHFGCVDGISQCADNSSFGFEYPGYVWTYETGVFSFNTGISAFGLDLGSQRAPVPLGRTVSLNGFNTTIFNKTPAFFGIATDDGSLMTSVTLAGVSTGDLFDNVTYRLSVPEPSSLSLFTLALALAASTASIRRKRLNL